jgi:quinol monooxygenase YgiN
MVASASTDTDERHIICTVRAKAVHRAEVAQLLLELVAPARLEDGCLYYDVYQDTEDADAFRIVDGWASEQAVAAHLEHPNVPRVVDRLLPLLEQPLQLVTGRRISNPDQI